MYKDKCPKCNSVEVHVSESTKNSCCSDCNYIWDWSKVDLTEESEVQSVKRDILSEVKQESLRVGEETLKKISDDSFKSLPKSIIWGVSIDSFRKGAEFALQKLHSKTK